MVKVIKDYPIIPLRDVVVFPGIVTTLFVGTPPDAASITEERFVIAE